MAVASNLFNLTPRTKRKRNYTPISEAPDYPANGDNSEVNDFAFGKGQRYETGEGAAYTPTTPSESVTPSMAQYDPNFVDKQGVVDLVNKSNANFVSRLKDPNRKTLNLGNGDVATHKMAWGTVDFDDGSHAVIYPQVQEIDGKLVDMSTDPDKAFNSAMKNKDFVVMPSEEAAEWFTNNNYKEYYPNFNYGKTDNSDFDYTLAEGVTPNVTTPVASNPYEDAIKANNERLKNTSNADFLKAQGLDTSAQMQKDYDEYMKNAPEYVSEEEQARRLRSSQSAKTVADLGSLASAFANLYTTDNGGYNQEVAYAKAPDYNAYINQWTKQRDAYKTYAQKGRDYVYQKQMQKAQNDYNRELQKLNLEYKQAQIDFQKANSNSKLIGDAIKQEQLELAQQKALNDYNYKLQTLNQRQAYNNAQIGLGYQRLAEDTRHHVQIEQKSSGKGSNKNWHIEGENGLSVDVPTANMNDYNRNQLLKLCGSDGTIGTGEKVYDVDTKQMVEKTKPMTKEQKWTYIAEHMTPEAEDYIKRLGGQVSRREPIKEEEEPVPATPSYASPNFWGQTQSEAPSFMGGAQNVSSSQQTGTTESNTKSFGSNYKIKDSTKATKSSGKKATRKV